VDGGSSHCGFNHCVVLPKTTVQYQDVQLCIISVDSRLIAAKVHFCSSSDESGAISIEPAGRGGTCLSHEPARVGVRGTNGSLMMAVHHIDGVPYSQHQETTS
jgi:hypothetical protein